ncbi:hypothetical protein COO60DRAFT_1584346 [Scenedesmus sp. NREL 46B-D3]|nr:hypothetical protein COO60DRAFT_1584346 [Scenedesmus sp. NREL 46B-D3]
MRAAAAALLFARACRDSAVALGMVCALPHLQHTDKAAVVTTSHLGAAARAAGTTVVASLSSSSCCSPLCAGVQYMGVAL